MPYNIGLHKDQVKSRDLQRRIKNYPKNLSPILICCPINWRGGNTGIDWEDIFQLLPLL